MKQYRSLLSELEYMKVLIATFITRIGDGIDVIAFSWLVYEITGSTVLVATIYGVNMIPNLLFGMVSGGLCKYIGEKSIMWICDLGRFACVAIIATLYMSDHLMVWHLFVITFLNSTFEAFRSPASVSVFPKILETSKQELGLAMQETLMSAANLIGYAAGPMCIGFLGLGGAILVDAISFLLSGIMIMMLQQVKADSQETITVKRYLNDMKEGFIFYKKDRLMLKLSLFGCFTNLMFTPVNVFEAPYIKDFLMMGSEGLSVSGVSNILGMILISPFLPKIKEHFDSHKLIVYSGCVIGICVMFLFGLPYIPTLMMRYVGLALCMGIIGVSIAILNFPINAAIYKRIPQSYLARYMAVVRTLSMCAMPLGSFVFGGMSSFLSIDMILLVSGMLLISMCIGLRCIKSVSELNAY